ncbi:MAG: glycosyltransferase family 1 protein [Balneolaceae bacterium]
MNIILDTSTIQQEMSGTGYYTKGMLRELLKMDSILTVQALGGSLDMLKPMDNGKMVYHFPDETNWHRLVNVKMLANRRNIKGDIALFPNYFIPAGLSIPSIATVHDLSFLSHPHFYNWKMRTYYRHRIKHTFKNAARILTVSDESKKNILSYSGRLSPDIISIPPGPTLPLKETTALSDAPSHYFLLNGNIELRKNVVPVIKAFLNTPLDGFHLVIAGKRNCGNKYWREFKNLISQSNRVHYLGYIDNQKLKQWYTDAGGIVCCSFIEGFGIPALNARTMNKPCLISNHPALREAAGEEALIVNPDDQKDISRGFRQLANYVQPENLKMPASYQQEYEFYWKTYSNRLKEVIHKTVFDVKHTSTVSFSRPVNSALKKTILETLAYSAVFKAPMLMSECYRELHYTHCSYENFKQAVWELKTSYPRLITQQGAYVGLTPYIQPIEKYRLAYNANSEYIRKNRHLIRTIGKLPWISGIYFSGGTVHATHISHKDLDLFIVAKSNRIWLVYTLLKFTALITKSTEKLCFNYLIDEDNLYIETQQDLYTAHQLVHLKPAIENIPQPDLKKFNTWVYKFFPNRWKKEKLFAGEQKESVIKRGDLVMETANLLFMAAWGRLWNRKGIQNRTGGIRWDAHQIKLHTNDHRPYVYQQFAAIKADILKQMEVNQNDPIEMNINKNCG